LTEFSVPRTKKKVEKKLAEFVQTNRRGVDATLNRACCELAIRGPNELDENLRLSSLRRFSAPSAFFCSRSALGERTEAGIRGPVQGPVVGNEFS
jgi:hypothetical protein